MSNDPKLVAAERNEVGTNATKRLRNEGRTPGTLYGHNEGTRHFAVEAEALQPIIASGHKVVDLEIGGAIEKTMIQDVQWDTFSQYVLHFDLLRVNEKERVTTDVELVTRGIAPGVLAGGILELVHHSLPIECPVIRLPEQVTLRINKLQIGDSITVGDLELPTDVTTSLPPEEVLVHIVAPKAAPVLDDEEEGAEGDQAAPEAAEDVARAE
ncbi:50S ribosomal protein L25 [bacterium]|nr:50S ribosomal protein L25 [bacterium]